MSDFELGEMDRRMACLTQSAVVEAITYDPPRVKVRVGDWVSDWLKWQAGAAGKVRHWRPPSVDEEVALWAPSGDLAGAFVAPGYYTEQHGGAGRSSPDETATDFPDGAFEQYNHASHEYVLSVPAAGRIVFRIGGTELELKADGATLRSAKLLADVPDSTFTGNTTIEQLLTFNGGMQGKPGAGGGVAMKVVGGAEFTDDVVAAAKSVSKHSHWEQGDGERVSLPI
ncbi:phage baseplate assembly protein V [Burkholderia cenocepacia]|uniref:phage baseplate assembly protein V n=1 Tax=Burkholderia cenocepacia TaxID=95486 RepID=UPI0022EAADEC|nr:phage baseplate assembly protein V [Burkholderia cenocepacia]MDA3675242.1 phage baseplate assembly protein V [Burkholderia cenocepacia]MDA3683225.1 phage baseplate assembly protein V [Burkholderia cenocepacia]MDA3690060.1 phage baseplate assembly protein V [Burkholderia cenocepacia]MDA3697986.1 phage baseplate assembly protein V [Burkholderia cenocepacia]MDA3704828.1 phage baseplate assembly protein V [Burkholderia cenocepacia]